MEERKLSIIVPALNEADNLPKLLERIHSSCTWGNITYEVIIIDDHSTDETLKLVEILAKTYPVHIFLKQGLRGKAQSLIEGFSHAQYELCAMVDADLQYPPEAIPEMVDKIVSGDADIVVANRIERDTSFSRKFVSQGFKFIFARFLHGLKCDVQSGLKVFRTKIIREISIDPTPWTFDLEFLIHARDAGNRIETVEIMFSERSAGESKIRLFDAITEIGINAIRVKFKHRQPSPIQATREQNDTGKKGNMLGAGIQHQTKKFITHTTLPSTLSAIITFTGWQKIFIISVVVIASLGFLFAPLGTAIVTMAILSFIYFIDVLFNFSLVMLSLRNPPEFKFTKEQIDALHDKELPVYTVLCPLYRESHILPGFLEAMDKLDWPKEKLDILLLLEEDDKQTIQAAYTMELPDYVRVLVVPHSLPKTKPKACNYGLDYARGDFLVIYDAEDIPEPQQLKKAYLGFDHALDTVKCLQAKLNYHNSDQNLLTRLFTAEYSLWFEVILPGLQSVNGYIPLGGTSNHFRTKDLRTLEGWDPFNVTEDCDLGARIFKRGWRTAIIDSVTLEEANSNLGNWLRQRSRWIKGYMQTYLVHMREPIKFFRHKRADALMFQLVVGGKIAFLVINPILWVATISYFVFRPIVGPTFEAIYPAPVFYMAVLSLVLGNFLYFYYYMIGAARRGHWQIIKYVFFIPFYWFMASVAASIATWQLFVKPHYWEKTHHGLHLKKIKDLQDEASGVQPVEETTKEESAHAPKPRRRPAFLEPVFAHSSGAAVLIGAMIVANALNFLYNAFLGRVLSFEELGLVTLINTIWLIAAIFVGGIGHVMNYNTAYLTGAKGKREDTSIRFLRTTMRRAGIIAIVFAAIWLISIPLLSEFFQTTNRIALISLAPTLLLGIIASANRGFLRGKLMFTFVGFIVVMEASVKLLVAILFVSLKLPEWTFLSVPISITITAIAAYLFAKRVLVTPQPITKEEKYAFPTGFYSAVILGGLASIVFLSADIILAKHYFSPELAGQYALLSLAGKIIYFFGVLPGAFMLTFVARSQGMNRDPIHVFRAIFLITLGLVGIGVVAIGPFGHITMPLLFGEKAFSILNYLNMYVIAMGIFTLGNAVINYHLAKKQYIFPITAFAFSLLMTGGIILFHQSIQALVAVIAITSTLNFVTLATLHRYEDRLDVLTRNATDFVEAFVRRPSRPIAPGKQRILVFNWRDTKHKFAGGSEVYIQEMAKRWVTQNHQVTLFCGNDGRSPRYEIVEGIETYRHGGFYFVYVWAFLYYFLQFRGKYDVIVDCHNGIPFFTPLFSRKPIFCVIYHVHQEVFRRSLTKPLAMLATFLERDLMPLVYRSAKFITISDSTRSDIVNKLNIQEDRVQIVHSGVDLESHQPGTKSPVPMILYLGRLKAYKSIDVLVTAFKILSERLDDAILVIAGSGEEDRHLKRLASQLGIQERVFFTGKVSEERKRELLQRAWVMVNPSFIEGWGITTIEANACGTPVVAADVPGLRDSVRKDTGFLIPHGDSAGFANTITSIIHNRELRNTLEQRSHKWAQNFSWNKTSTDFLSAISQNE